MTFVDTDVEQVCFELMDFAAAARLMPGSKSGMSPICI